MIDLNLPNQSQPVDGLICAGQPTREQFEAAAEQGVKTVVNLRAEGELQRDIEDEVTSAGMRYVHIPISGPDDLTFAKAEELSAAIDASDGPVLVHCGSSNRVGALLALKSRLVDGNPPHEAMELGTKAGLSGLSPVVRKLM